MKALIYQSPNQIAISEVPRPEPKPGQALIAVHAAGICGSDMAIVSGNHPRAPMGLIPGHEFSGQVVEINPDSRKSDLSPGDKVAVFPLLTCGGCWACTHGHPHVCRTLRLIGIDQPGGFAEYATIPLDLIVRVPPSLSYPQAALIEPVAVGIHAVDMGQVASGDRVIVLGAGPIGLTVSLALRQAGTREIRVVEPNPYRRNLAIRMGMETIDPSRVNLAKEIAMWTDQEGADILFECTGAASAIAGMIELVRPRARIMLVGCPKTPPNLDVRMANFKEVALIGSRVYTREDFQTAVDQMQANRAEMLISHRLPLENAPAAFDIMKQPEQACKVIMEMEPR